MQPLVKLESWAIGLLSEKELGGKPASCLNCTLFYVTQNRCAILGPTIIIATVTKEGQIYTPVCGAQDVGEPSAVLHASDVQYRSLDLGDDKADSVGLEWAKGTGTNCAGKNGAAACTKHYEKINEDEGNCQPLQDKVQAGACCVAHNGPSMQWREAQLILRPV